MLEYSLDSELVLSSAEEGHMLSADLARPFVTILYSALLDRTPDYDGLEHHILALRNYEDIPFLVRSFAFSAEARENELTGLQFARFLIAARRLSQIPDPLLDAALVYAARDCLIPNSDLRLPIENLSEISDVKIKADADGAIYLGEEEDNRLVVFVLGASSCSLNATREDGSVLFDAPVDSAFELFEIVLPFFTEQEEILRIRLNDGKLWRQVRIGGPGFASVMDAALETRLPNILIQEIDKPLFVRNVFEKPDADALFETLFRLIGPASNLALDTEIGNRDMIEWSVLDLPEDRRMTGYIELPTKIQSALLEEVIGQDLLGYSVNLHIFLFARRHGYLAQLFASFDGLVDTYRRFLTSGAYTRLSRNDLVPAKVLAALGVPVTVNRVRMNKFWHDALQEMAGQTPLSNFSSEHLRVMVAERFSHALINDLFEPLLPMEWFSLYRRSYKKAENSQFTGQKVVDSWQRRRQARVFELLRNYPMEQLRSKGWVNADMGGSSSNSTSMSKNLVTVIGHRGGHGLARVASDFRDAFDGIGLANRFVYLEALDKVVTRNVGEPRIPARSVNLFSINADKYAWAAASLASMNAERPGCLRIGSFFWETSRAPKIHRSAGPLLDEVWASTDFIRQIYLNLYDGKVPVRTMGMSVSVPKQIEPFPFWSIGLPSNEFVFLNVSDFDSSIVRKNPLPVVQAFHKAFPKETNVRLILKIRRIDRQHWSNTNQYWDRVVKEIAHDPRITIITGDLFEDDYWSLLASAGCYVTLHRGEGFGYGAAHAMLLGVPVISTDFSGTQDFCTEKTALLVPAKEIPVAFGDMPYHEDLGVWAEPDVDIAADRMRQVWEEEQRVTAMVKVAKKNVTSLYSPQALQTRVAARLYELGV